MDINQYEDIPKIQFADEMPLEFWSNDYYNPLHSSRQLGARTVNIMGEDMPYDGFHGSSVLPMERYLHGGDPSPLAPGLLSAKLNYNMRLQIGNLPPYEQQWPNTDCMYEPGNNSPDRTDESDDSSHAPQNELRSPQPIHQIPYGTSGDYSLSHQNTELFHGGSIGAELLTHDRNISLRELEYEHHESDVAVEEHEHTDIKPDFGYEHEPSYPKPEAVTEDFRTYPDSGTGHSHRDAESVQFMTPSDEEDSDYKPEPGTKKRRRSSTSSHRSTKRRSHTRKQSTASNISRASRVIKKPRGTKASHVSDGDDRPFPCPLARYGCTSNFASKNEWKRHVATQHIKLGFWRCDLCSTTHDPRDSTTIYHNDFNRKDLFTQHLRRMHLTKPAAKGEKAPAAAKKREAEEAQHQKRCYQSLRLAPAQSECLFCDKSFSGESSWENRQEHVGRHMEKDNVSLDWSTWRVDDALEQYFIDEGLVVQGRDGGWKLGDGKPRRGVMIKGYEAEHDEE